MTIILQIRGEPLKPVVEVLKAEIKRLEGDPENSNKIDQLNEVLNEILSELDTEKLLNGVDYLEDQELSVVEIPGEKEEETEEVQENLNVCPGQLFKEMGVNVIYELGDENGKKD